MRKRIVITTATVAGLLLIGGGTAIALTNTTVAPVSEKSDKVISVPVAEHAVKEAKSSSATPSPSTSEKAAAAQAVEAAKAAEAQAASEAQAVPAPVDNSGGYSSEVGPASPNQQDAADIEYTNGTTRTVTPPVSVSDWQNGTNIHIQIDPNTGLPIY